MLAQKKHNITDGDVRQAQRIADLIIDQNANTNNLTIKEKARLNILELQSDQKKNQRDIDNLLSLGLDTLNDAQLRTIAMLHEENKEEDAQIEKQKKIIANAETHAGAEAKVTEELKKQNATQDVSVSGSNFGGFVQGESTAALTGTIQKLNAQLNAPGRDGRPISQADQNANYGDFATAALLKGQLDIAQKELDLRNQVVSYDKRYGDTATAAQFGDSITQRALQGFSTDLQKTNTVLTAISQQLSSSGIFPGAAHG